MAKRSFYKKVYFKSPFVERMLSFLRVSVFVFLIIFSLILAIFIFYAKDLPRPERFFERQVFQPTEIYDRTGEILLYTIFGEEKRQIIPLTEIPDYLKQAAIATEDANFYHHFGLDYEGIVRAILANLKLKKSAQGASTISQQLIRSTFLTTEKSLKRKVREIILTLELERRYSKDQILEWYLNQVPFGSNCYGVEAASQTFFGKKAKELTLAESATLAALIRSPNYLSPYGEHKEELLERKDYILNRMTGERYIDKERAGEAKKEELVFKKLIAPIKAPHFVIYLQKQLINEYGEEFLKENGLKVYSTLNWELQELAEEMVKKGVQKNKRYRAYNAALVAIDPNSGEILSLVGSADYFAEPYPENCQPGANCLFEPEFDVATLGNRQPGSAFKPFAYITAFQKGYPDNYVVIDEETNFGIWGGKPYIPQNYDGRFRGPVILREALAQSLNVPSVKVFLNLAGIKDTIETAKLFGITTLKDSSFYGPSLVLGGGEVRLLDMVSAYGVFATEGLKNPPVVILKIVDSKGNTLKEYRPNPKRVMSSNPAEMINDILSDNELRAPVFGLNSPLYIKDHKVSAKTGTTQYFNDGWIIGYNKGIVVGVWAGNNDNSSTAKEPGIVLAAPIWREFILEAIKKVSISLPE